MPSDTSDSTNINIEELLEKFSSGSLRQQRRLIDEVESRSKELREYGLKLFENFDPNSDNWTIGWILQVLNRHEKDFLKEILNLETPKWFSTPSSQEID